MRYTPKQIPDERTIQIMMGQAWNLATEIIGADILHITALAESEFDRDKFLQEKLGDWQQYFFDQLMKPYEPLLKARQEKEDLFNGKIRKNEIKEEQKGEINYEENND